MAITRIAVSKQVPVTPAPLPTNPPILAPLPSAPHSVAKRKEAVFTDWFALLVWTICFLLMAYLALSDLILSLFR